MSRYARVVFVLLKTICKLCWVVDRYLPELLDSKDDVANDITCSICTSADTSMYMFFGSFKVYFFTIGQIFETHFLIHIEFSLLQVRTKCLVEAENLMKTMRDNKRR